MKKLLAALASLAFVGTVFAQTGVPASAKQTGQGGTKDHVTSATDKKDVHATPHKSAPKATHQKVTKAGKTTKASHVTSAVPAPQPGTTKPASVDKTKAQ